MSEILYTEPTITAPAIKPETGDLPSAPVMTELSRVYSQFQIQENETLTLREAKIEDVTDIQSLYREVYQGRYNLEFATNPEKLAHQIRERGEFLMVVAEAHDSRRNPIVGCLVLSFNQAERLGKASGAVVLPEFRGSGLGCTLLKHGVRYLADEKIVDVMYATSRTINEAPSRMVEEAGFIKMGIFPNAVQVENMEHLSLDVYLTDRALEVRRKKPYIFSPYHEVYDIARKRLGLEDANLVTEFHALKLDSALIEFDIVADETETLERFQELESQNRLANSFFPFHRPNVKMTSADGSSEVFVWFAPKHRMAAIVGYRTDRTNVHDLLDSVARSLNQYGASYVEFLVDVYDYQLQQAAYTARYIPSAYFPSMRLKEDGSRDDVFVLSRSFTLLDFTGTVMKGDSRAYLQAYLRRYYELYLKPILGT